MRIRTILKAAAVPGIIAAGLLGTTLAASAQTLPTGQATHPNGNSGISQMTGKNGIVYDDIYGFGWVRCNEVAHPAHNGQSAFDNISCTFVTSGTDMTPVAQSALAGTSGTYTGEWNSDFTTGPTGNLTGGTLTWTVNAAGTGYTGTATYPAPPAG
jgi:hypothetical protein